MPYFDGPFKIAKTSLNVYYCIKSSFVPVYDAIHLIPEDNQCVEECKFINNFIRGKLGET